MAIFIEYGTRRILGTTVQVNAIWSQIKALETDYTSGVISIALKDADRVLEEIHIQSGVVLPDGRVLSTDDTENQ